MFQTGLNLYNQFFYVKTNPRTRDWFLMGSPVQFLLLIGVYILVTKILDTLKAHDKKVVDTKYCVLALNCVIASLSWCLLFKVVKYMIWSNYDFQCMPVDTSTRPEVIEVSFIILIEKKNILELN